MHGYDVKWNDGHKYITFTDKNGHVCRDNKLFDERFLRKNLEIYFALGGCNSELFDRYMDYQTPEHPEYIGMTASDGLITLFGNILSCSPNTNYYTPRPLNERDWREIKILEEILGRRIEPKAFACYSTKEHYEQEKGLGMYM